MNPHSNKGDLRFTHNFYSLFRKCLWFTGLSPTLACCSKQLEPFQLLENKGLIRVRSPLLTESRLIFFPLVTEMFQFTR